MTPKNEAYRLYYKYSEADYTDLNNLGCISCALIAVEELIQESDVYRVDEFKNEERFNYWQEVKEELIKLKQ